MLLEFGACPNDSRTLQAPHPIRPTSPSHSSGAALPTGLQPRRASCAYHSARQNPDASLKPSSGKLAAAADVEAQTCCCACFDDSYGCAPWQQMSLEAKL